MGVGWGGVGWGGVGWGGGTRKVRARWAVSPMRSASGRAQHQRLPVAAPARALGVAWRGVAWRGVAWRGVAWRGVVWLLCSMLAVQCQYITHGPSQLLSLPPPTPTHPQRLRRQQRPNLRDYGPIHPADHHLVALAQHAVDQHHINGGAQTLDLLHLQDGALRDGAGGRGGWAGWVGGWVGGGAGVRGCSRVGSNVHAQTQPQPQPQPATHSHAQPTTQPTSKPPAAR